MRTIVLILATLMLTACAYTVTVQQAPAGPTIPPLPTIPPVSPLSEPVMVPLEAVEAPTTQATFTYDDLVKEAGSHDVVLWPGSYHCQLGTGGYTFCRIVAPGLTRAALCVWPGGSGVCE